MISLYKIENNKGVLYKVENGKIVGNGNYISVELRGLSTDTKPTTINEKPIDNGSIFIEIDTGKVFLFDAVSETWKEI